MGKIIKLILISFVILSCQNTITWTEKPINQEIRVFSEKSLNLKNDYLFKWSAPLKYPEKTADFDIQPDYNINGKYLFFTPKTNDSYYITLDVTDAKDSLIFQESFHYNVVGENLETTISNNKEIEVKPKDKPLEKNDLNKDTIINIDNNDDLSIDNQRYTIQLAVWQTREKAIEDKIFLISNGYDAYIEDFIKNESKNTVYRVRVGSFDNQSKAEEVKNDIIKKHSRWGTELRIANIK